MFDKHAEQDDYIQIQIDMLEAARNRGFPPARLARLSGLKEPTIKSWARGAAMPVWCFSILCRHLPDEITTLMMEPSDRIIVHIEGADCDGIDEFHEEIAGGSAEIVSLRRAAPGKRLNHTHEQPIRDMVRRVIAKGARLLRSGAGRRNVRRAA